MHMHAFNSAHKKGKIKMRKDGMQSEVRLNLHNNYSVLWGCYQLIKNLRCLRQLYIIIMKEYHEMHFTIIYCHYHYLFLGRGSFFNLLQIVRRDKMFNTSGKNMFLLTLVPRKKAKVIEREKS